MGAMAEYVQSPFHLQHNITMIVMQQCLCMATYDELYIATSR
jgi:hypothetical protein